MTSNANIIRDALGLIGVIAEVQNATPEQTDIGLRVLNEMLDDWRARGVDLEFSPQSEVSDETPIPDEAIVAVKYGLAVMLAPYFEQQVSPLIIAVASSAYNRILRDALHLALDEADMSHLPASRAIWNIDSDT